MVYRPIDDKKTIRDIRKKYDLKKNSTFNYVVQGNNISDCTPLKYKGKMYMLKYFSGCFYPYLSEEAPKTENVQKHYNV